MDDATGAAPTKRCPRCAQHRTREHFTPSGWRASGSYCKPCRTEASRKWRAGKRVMNPLPAAELARLRSMVACLGCGAVPRKTGMSRHGHEIVRAKHTPDCSAAERRLKDTG